MKKSVSVVAAVICSGGLVLATQRGYGEYKDFWEFPGGKIEPGETPRQALAREIREELNAEIAVGDLLETVDYEYPTFHLHMDCFWATVTAGRLTLLEHEAARWLRPEELDTVDWLPADRSILGRIREKLTAKP